MTVRKTTFLIFGIAVVGFILSFYLAASRLLLAGFEQLEAQEMRRNVQRATDALHEHTLAFSAITADYAAWRQTYELVAEERSPQDYINTSFPDQTFEHLDIDVAAVVRNDGRVVFVKAYDAREQRESAVPPALLSHLNNPALWRHTTPDSSVTGILLLPEGPMMMTSHPVQPRNRAAPIGGALLMGRFIDADEITRLAHTTHQSTTLHTLDDAAVAAISPEDWDRATIPVLPLSHTSVAGYARLNDIYGNPALALRITSPRNIYYYGEITTQYLLIALLAIGALLGILMLFTLERMVLSRLSRISRTVRNIGASGNFSARVIVRGSDELAKLANAINGMLAALNQTNAALEQRVQQRTHELTEANQALQNEVNERLRAEQRLRETEERHRTFIEQSSDSFMLIDEQGAVIEWNRSLEQLTGLSRQQVLGLPIWELMFQLTQCEQEPARWRERTRMLALTADPHGFQPPGILLKPHETEFVVQRADGACRIVQQRAFPIYTDHNMRIGAVIRDITAQKQAEADVREALSRTQELYEISRQIGLTPTPVDVLRVLLTSAALRDAHCASILVFDQPCRENETPEGAARVFMDYCTQERAARLSDEADESRPVQVFYAGLLPSLTAPLLIADIQADPRIDDMEREQLAHKGTRSLLFFPLVAGGQWYAVLVIHFPAVKGISNSDIRHIQGLVDQAAATIYNIRLLEREATARQQAERANEVKVRFLAMISHELRTPLTSIKGFATTLLADDVTWDASSQRSFIEIINQESDKLADMIEQLLDLSRITAGTLRVSATPQPLPQVIAAARAQLDTLTQCHQLIIDVPDDLPAVMADRQRMAQVLTNLVGNAAKYSPKHSEIILKATPSAQGDFIQISIRDHGIGIPLRERADVFRPFERGAYAVKKQTVGAGLGLAICRGLVEAHGGAIWIEGHEGPGTLVVFTLPVAKMGKGASATHAAGASNAARDALPQASRQGDHAQRSTGSA